MTTADAKRMQNEIDEVRSVIQNMWNSVTIDNDYLKAPGNHRENTVARLQCHLTELRYQIDLARVEIDELVTLGTPTKANKQ